MFSDINDINSAAMVHIDAETVTVHHGTPEAFGEDRPNRLDIAEGWTSSSRVHRPGALGGAGSPT